MQGAPTRNGLLHPLTIGDPAPKVRPIANLAKDFFNVADRSEEWRDSIVCDNISVANILIFFGFTPS